MMNIFPDANMNDVKYILRPVSMATTKRTYKARITSKLHRLRSKLFHGDKKILQSTLIKNLNSDTPVKRCYNKDIRCATRSAHYQTCRRVPPVRMRGDGADDVTMTELLLRTRGDDANNVTACEHPARTPGAGIENNITGPRSVCDLDAAFLSEEETFDVCDLDICVIDDVSVTSLSESALIEEYESDSVCELEKNVFDDGDVSMTTLTRLRSVFSDGGNIEALVSDSALESFMRD